MKLSRIKLFVALAAIFFLLGCSSLHFKAPLVELSEKDELIIEVLVKKNLSGRLLPNENELAIQFLGNATLNIKGAKQSVLIDGFLTRPNALELIFWRIKSQEDVVKPILCEAKINNVQAIIPLHSHYDHIMDAPYLAKEFGACIIADASAKAIMKSQRIIHTCNQNPNKKSQDAYFEGRFDIEVFDAIHSDSGLGKCVAPLHGQVDSSFELDPTKKQRAKNYKEGRSLNVFFEHDSGVKIFVVGGLVKKDSKGNVETFINKFNDADIVFLSTPLLQKKKNPEFNALIHDLLSGTGNVGDKTSQKILVPLHWDKLTKKLPANPEACDLDKKHKSKNLASVSRKQRLKENWFIRDAIKDTQALDKPENPNVKLIWMTAYDQLNIKAVKR